MRSFNKLANLHRVFFKKSEGVLPKPLRGLEDFSGPKGYLTRKGLPIPSKPSPAALSPVRNPIKPPDMLPTKSSVMPGPSDVDPRMPGNSLPPGTDLRTYYNK